MVKSIQPDGYDYDTVLLGTIEENGDLKQRKPFAKPRSLPRHTKSIADINVIPTSTRIVLEKLLANRKSGLLLFGSAIIEEHSAIDLIAASLPLTDHIGPAARVMPRDRSTPAKDWQVPDAIKSLPFLPSIESAYDQGYKRLIFDPNYTQAELLLKFGKDILFISGTYGGQVDDIFMSSLRSGGRTEESDLLALVIAIIGITPVPIKHGTATATDLFVTPQGAHAIQANKFEDILNYLAENRIIKWQDEMTSLLDSGQVTPTSIKNALPRSHYISNFLSQRALLEQ